MYIVSCTFFIHAHSANRLTTNRPNTLSRAVLTANFIKICILLHIPFIIDSKLFQNSTVTSFILCKLVRIFQKNKTNHTSLVRRENHNSLCGTQKSDTTRCVKCADQRRLQSWKRRQVGDTREVSRILVLQEPSRSLFNMS